MSATPFDWKDVREMVASGHVHIGGELAVNLIDQRAELLGALKGLRKRVQYWAENPRPDEWILQEWVRVIDDAIAKAEVQP